MQTKTGGVPNGLVADEFQSLMKFKLMPAAQAHAKEFWRPGQPGFTAEKQSNYEECKKELGWNERRDGPLVMYSLDGDSRHSFNDMQKWRLHGIEQCRTQLPLTDERRIALKLALQCTPSAPKACDNTQMPVENMVGVGKRAAKAKLSKKRKVNSYDIAKSIMKEVPAAVTPKKCANAMAHAVKVMPVFYGKRGETVRMKIGARFKTVHCVEGRPMPKELRA